MKKQILSIILCLCMLMSILPVSVLAKTDDTISFDISEGSIYIENGTEVYTFKVLQGSNTADNIDPSTNIEISGTTISNTITVSANHIEDGTPLPVNIILDGVNIDVSGINYACAFNITSSAGAVNITLAEGSINTLKSGKDRAALQKSNNTSSFSGEKAGNDVLLTIGGTGTLNATGYEYCAGIGGKIGDSCNYLTISGGIINANGGGYGGAGIGGGFTGGASNITIRGGTITANSNGGAGIGGGNHANASNIVISGGTVVANGSSGGAGIGAGRSVAANLYGDCSGIYISGGMITATGGAEGSGIGGGKGGDCNGVFISGGTIVANGGSGGDGIGSGAPLFTPPFPGDEFGTGDFTYGITENIVITGGNIKAISFGGTPKNGSDDSAVNVYKVTFTVPGATDGTLVESLSIGGYNTTGIKTLDTNKVYLYLPSNSEDTSTLAVYNSAYYTAMVKSDGSAVFSINSPYISELAAVDEVSTGEKINPTAPTVTAQGFTILSESWQIKKSGGSYQAFDPSSIYLDMTYHNALLRYFVTYTDGTEKTVYSNEVTVTVGKAVGSVTDISDISKIYDGSAVSEPTYTANNTGTATVEYKIRGAADTTYSTTRPWEVGNYTLRVSVAEDDNYNAASATKDFAITFLTSPANPFTLSPAANTAGWHNSDVTITPASGYTLSTSLNGTYSSSQTVSETVSDYTVYLKNAQGQMTDTITVDDIKIDKDAPTNISVEYDKDTSFRNFLNTITFGLFFKERIQVHLFASDNNSRMKEFKYTLNGTEYTVAASGIVGMVSFYIDPQFMGNISNIKAIDNAGNVSAEKATEYFAVDSQTPAAPTVYFGGKPTNVWIWEDMNITVSGSSAVSGIAKYQYTTNGGETWIDMTTTEADEATAATPYNAKKASLLLDYDVNALTYSFRAVSNAGNVGAASPGQVVKIDKFKPVMIINGNNSDYKQSDTITFDLEFGNSGIMFMTVCKDYGDRVTITDSYQDGYTVTENGLYLFEVFSMAGKVTSELIEYRNLDSAKPVISINSNGYEEDSWQNSGNVTLSVSNATANFGTSLIQYKVGSGSWQDYTAPIVISNDTAAALYTFKATSASGVVSDEKTFTIKRDTVIPDGDIKIKENSVKKFINTISFDLFFKENVDVTISSTDATSGVESVKYYRSDKILIQAELNAVDMWENYTGTISETAADTQKFVYYVKITDNAGNVTLFGSDGVTFDTSAPVLSGIAEGKAYKPDTEVTVSDATDVTVTLNGNPITLQDNKFNLTGQTGNVTVEVTDAAGNKTTITITVNDEGLLIVSENNPDGSVTVTKTNNDGDVVEILITYSDGSTDQTLNNADGTSVETKKDSSGNVTETTVTQSDGSSVKTENKPDGSVVETKKDSSGNVTETTVTQSDGSSVKTENKPDGSVVKTKKDSSGNVTETTATQPDGSAVKTENKPDGSTVETKKDSSGDITETTVTQSEGSSVKTENKPDGSVVETKKDSSGNVTETTATQPDGSSVKTENKPDGSTVETKKDSSGDITETTVTQSEGSSVKTENKPDGSVVETKKDSSGNVTETTATQPDGSSVKTENKPDGSTVETKKDSSGDITETTVTQSDGSSVKTENKPDGSVVKTKKDSSGNVTETTATQPDGSSVKTENKPDGSVVETKKDSSGDITETIVTQSDGSSVKTENKPDGSVVETKKDSSGNVTETTVTQSDGSSVKTENKPDGSVVETKKDSSGNVTETTVTQSDGSSVKTENKPDGSVVKTKKDSSGNVTETTATQPDGSSVKTENKPDGSVVETKKDSSGNVTETTVTQSDGSSVKTENKPDGSVVKTKKDSSGNVTETTATQPDGSSVKTENKPDGSTVETKKDSSGDITETTVTQSDGSSVKTENKPDGSVVKTKKDSSGNVTETTATQPDGSSVKTENKPDGSVVETKKDSSGDITETIVTQSDGSSVKTENKPDGSVVETKKDSSGNVTETTVTQSDGSSVKTENKSDGSTVETKKDSSGDITETIVTQSDGSSVKTENKPDGSVVETKKDSSGNVTETTVTQSDGSSVKTENKSDGSTVETKKDSSGDITETTVTQPDGSSVKTENKSDGSTLVIKTDEDGAVTETTVIAADGSKTITIHNADGTKIVTKYDSDGKVINDKDTDNSTAPHTVESNNMILWITLLLISCGIIFALAIARKHRNHIRTK